ncbi:MAG: PLP-dependent aminotransferase family protein [Desulfobacterales bacterium]|nr:PLP-dependent aminotransferase family protein [Desulfobacterales bacterium]
MLTLSDSAHQPLYQQIYEQLKAGILAGDPPAGKRLSSIRALARELGVGKNTVTAAYQQLCDEGYIENRPRSGFVVAELEPGFSTPPDGRPPCSGEPLEEPGNPGWGSQPRYSHDFQYGCLGEGDFPLAAWRRITNQVLSGEGPGEMGEYPRSKGEPGLRRRLRDYLAASRGVRCRTEQIVMAPGTQWCMNILCRLLEDRSVAMEDPGYDGVRHVLSLHGKQLIPIPVGPQGLDPQSLWESSAQSLYITPSHQFPTGAVMPIRNRMQILEWAQARDGIIMEDDYDSELRYSGRPIPSIQGIDSHGCVVYLGTVSKAFSPALRLSYMVLPESLLDKYHTLFSRYASPVPWLEQRIFETFMEQGLWERHLRRACLANGRRHDVLVKSVRETMGDKVRIIGEGAGLHILLAFQEGTIESQALEKARAAGIRVYPVHHYYMDRKRYRGNQVLLGFAGMDRRAIPQGVARLARAWFDGV